MQSPEHMKTAGLSSDELAPSASEGSSRSRMSCVGMASISPRPIYGGPARSPTDRRKPVVGLIPVGGLNNPVIGSTVTPGRLGSIEIGGIRSGKHAASD